MRPLWFVLFGSMMLSAGLLAAMPASRAEKATVYPWSHNMAAITKGPIAALFRTSSAN